MTAILLPRNDRPAARSQSPPRVRLPWVVLLWALGYGAVRLHWALTDVPAFGPLGTDLMVFTGWSSVVLCAAAAVVALALATARSWRPVPVVAGWVVAVALVVSCPILLLDAVGLLIPGLGLPFHLGAFASRVVCLGGALTLVRCLVDQRRRFRGGCLRCGRTGEARRTGAPLPVQRWAWWAAYAAVAGCLLRLVAQVVVGLDDVPLAQGPSMVVFELGFLAAGVLLPLALVHSWGRIWPRWVPLLAGRRVPGWLLLGPGAAIGGGLSVYFGVGTGQLVVETVTGAWRPAGLPLWFFFVSMPAYLLWGVALLAATVACRRRTRRPCVSCGR